MADWNTHIRDIIKDTSKNPTGDVFKYALYKIIGRCDLQSKTIKSSFVIKTTEDYLWIQLMLTNPEPSLHEASLEKSSFQELSIRMQKNLKTLSAPVTFMVLLICGEFELAISELSKVTEFSFDALHFSICLAYYGILRVPPSPKLHVEAGTLLSSKKVVLSSKSEYYLYYFHIHKMLTKFVKCWISTDTSEMLHYLFIIGLFGTNLADSGKNSMIGQSANKFGYNEREYTLYLHETIFEILGETTSKYPQILGSFKNDSSRSPGVLFLFRSLIHIYSERDFMEKVVNVAANNAERAGKFTDAIQLYHLSQDCNKVISLVNRRMGNHKIDINLGDNLLQRRMEGDNFVVDSDSREQQIDPNVPLLDSSSTLASAEQILAYYLGDAKIRISLDQKIVATCSTLIQLTKVFSAAQQQNYELAIKLFFDLGIVPQNANNYTENAQKAEAFSELDDLIIRAMPSMMSMVSDSINNFASLTNKRSNIADINRQAIMRDLKEKIKALVSFAGSIKLRIPTDILAKMNKFSVIIG